MSDTIKENIENSYLFGCVKYKSIYSFYLMPVAYWILNYAKYDRSYNPNDWNDEDVFRDDILNVEDKNIERFIQAIQVDKIELNLIASKQYDFRERLLFFVDFDSKTFINFFDDIEIEEYLPDEDWVGQFGNPLNHLPEELKSYFF
jgi:hypothetical protein